MEQDRATSGNASVRSLAKWLLLLLSLAGFVVSLYLTFLHYRGILPRCYIVQGCDVVQTSRYATLFFGIPMAALGTAFFAVMFYLSIGMLTGNVSRVVAAFKILAYAGALVTIPLFLLQAVVLRAFCFYCLVTEVIMLLLWIGSFALRAARRPESPAVPAHESGPLKDGRHISNVGAR